jgi:hypothetical protein
VDLETLYAAQLADAENEPPEWNIQGRQADAYKWVHLPERARPKLTVIQLVRLRPDQRRGPGSCRPPDA